MPASQRQGPGRYEEYGTAWNVQSFMEDYGGEFIMMSNGPEAEVLEGKWSSRLVVMKFPDAEKARAWYDSPEYRDIRTIRWATAAGAAAAMDDHPHQRCATASISALNMVDYPLWLTRDSPADAAALMTVAA